MRSSDVNLATFCSELDFGGSLKSSFAALSKSYRKIILFKLEIVNNTKCIVLV